MKELLTFTYFFFFRIHPFAYIQTLINKRNMFQQFLLYHRISTNVICLVSREGSFVWSRVSFVLSSFDPVSRAGLGRAGQRRL